MKSIHPFDLPELLLDVASYLTKEDITRCLRVSKAWLSWFAPLIWEELDIVGNVSACIPNKLFPSKLLPNKLHPDMVISFREYVCRLTIRHDLPGHYTSTYPKLHTLKMESNFPNRYDCALVGNPTNLIALNPSLVHLTLVRLHGYVNAAFWRAVTGLPHLRALELNYSVIECNDVFWRACTNLERLSLTKVTFPKDGIISRQLTFFRMQSIKLSAFNLPRTEQLYFICRCVRLKELVWHATFNDRIVGKFIHYINEKRWPELERLDVGYNIPDGYLRQILDGLQRITKLNLSNSTVDNASFQGLQRHFNNLVELDHRGYSGFSSTMLRVIMGSCHRLVVLRSGGFIVANDAVKDSPWVCLSLKILQVFFEFGSSTDQDIQRAIFERLSTLKRLESLLVGRVRSQIWGEVRHALDLRLGWGIEALAKLENVRHVELCATGQKLEEKEIRWMLENWKRLEEVEGELSSEWQTRSDNIKLLKKNGIIVR